MSLFPSRRVFLRSAMGLGALISGASSATDELQWRTRALVGFGTTLDLRAAHDDAAVADAALDDAVGAVRRVEAQMSPFDASSALSRFNRDGVLRAPPADLLAVLRLAQGVSQRSDGAFDATVQPLWCVFEAARRAGRLPTPAAVAEARAKVDWRALEVADTHLRLHRPGMAVTLNGIAQGYAADLARDAMRARGVRHALLDTGEWASLGRSPQGRPWSLGIADPRREGAILARLVLDGRCVATSADDRTSFSADHRFHHIFDPHSGYSPTELASATVLAEQGALADALTKVMFVAGPKWGLAAAREWQVDVLLVDKARRLHLTPGMASMLETAVS